MLLQSYLPGLVAVPRSLCNIIIPGFGTMIQSYCDGRSCWNCGTFFVGVLQLILAPILVGWIWSIWHGIRVYEVSKSPI